MYELAKLFAVASTLVVVSATGVAAQQTTQDSIIARLEALQRRLDSLERVIADLRAAEEDTSEVADELAALRAAARGVADEGEPPDTTTQQVSRTRNLQVLNPEISVTGDVVANYVAPNGEETNLSFVPREFEFSFQSALDPYTRTKVFITYEEEIAIAGFPEEEEEEGGGGFGLEEGYLYWVGLPANIGLKIGKFRQEIGLYNRWHTHALFEVDRSLPAVTFLGEDGLIETGASVQFPSFTLGPSTQTFFFELSTGTNEALFGGGFQPAYLGRFQSFWDLGPSTFFQLGATGVYGQNGDLDLTTTLAQFDAFFRWRPAGRALYQDLQIKAEYYIAQQTVTGASENGDGGYLQLNYRFGRQWIAGARGDYLKGYGAQPRVYQLVPSLTWWQSEWVYVRLQYNYVKPQDIGGSSTLLLQFVWALGPHKHETY